MNKTVLVCDDDDGILDLIAQVLEMEGINVATEPQSRNIYDRIEKLQPTMLLVDLWMPVHNGEQITRNLKNNPQTKHIPVVIISASQEGREVARSLGADDFIAKPFDIEYLVEKVHQYLQPAI